MRIKIFFISVLLFICFLSLYWLAVVSKPGQIIDTSMLYAELGSFPKILLLSMLLNKGTELCVMIGLILIAIIGVGKKAYIDLIYIMCAILVSNVSTQILKHYIFERPDYSILYSFKNSYPSGHVTLITSIIFGFILILPVAYKLKFQFVGTVFIFIFGVAVCLSKWHRVSDVIGAIIMTTAVFLFFVFLRQVFSKNNIFGVNVGFSNAVSFKLPIISIFVGVIFIALLAVLYYSKLLVLATEPLKFIDFASGSIFSVISNIAVFFIILGVSSMSVKFVINSVLVR